MSSVSLVPVCFTAPSVPEKLGMCVICHDHCLYSPHPIGIEHAI